MQENSGKVIGLSRVKKKLKRLVVKKKGKEGRGCSIIKTRICR